MLLWLTLMMLGGCSQWSAIKVATAATAQKAADEALQVSLWQFCKAASIGSINRWAGGDQELADARKMVCGKVEQADVVVTNE